MFDQMQLLDMQNVTATSNKAVKFAVELSKQVAKTNPVKQPVNHSKSIETVLSDIFPTRKEENNLQKARRMLGDIAASLSDQELESYLTQFEFLLDSWLDDFERQIFDNKTLIELLKEG